MNRNVLLLLSFISLIVLLGFKYNGAGEKFYSFIGYVEQNPVFFESVSRSLVKDNNGKLEVIEKVTSSMDPVFIDNELIVFSNLDAKEGGELFLSKGEKKKKFETNDIIYNVVGDENNVFYSDNFNKNIIRRVSFEEDKETILSGYVVGFENQCLYFSKEHAPNLIRANADIFKYDFQINKQPPVKVGVNLSGEMTYIIPGGDYIFDKILHEGEYQPSILEVSTGMFSILDVDIEKYGSCYYSYFLNKLVFFDPLTMEKKILKLPNTYDLIIE